MEAVYRGGEPRRQGSGNGREGWALLARGEADVRERFVDRPAAVRHEPGHVLPQADRNPEVRVRNDTADFISIRLARW